MAQSITNRVVNSFVKGLVTEANELTFPDNASIDESNCDLQRTGSRRRRKAVALEDGAVDSGFTIEDDFIVNSFVWENAGSQAGLDLLVVHSGQYLYFYELSSANIAGNKKSFSIDMSTYNVANSYAIKSSLVQFVVVKGSLIVVSPATDAFFVEYDKDTDTVSSGKINFRVRDFGFIGSNSRYFTKVDMEGVEDTDENIKRKYDTKNSGWRDEELSDYATSAASDTSTEEDSGYQSPYDREVS